MRLNAIKTEDDDMIYILFMIYNIYDMIYLYDFDAKNHKDYASGSLRMTLSKTKLKKRYVKAN